MPVYVVCVNGGVRGEAEALNIPRATLQPMQIGELLKILGMRWDIVPTQLSAFIGTMKLDLDFTADELELEHHAGDPSCPLMVRVEGIALAPDRCYDVLEEIDEGVRASAEARGAVLGLAVCDYRALAIAPWGVPVGELLVAAANEMRCAMRDRAELTSATAQLGDSMSRAAQGEREAAETKHEAAERLRESARQDAALKRIAASICGDILRERFTGWKAFTRDAGLQRRESVYHSVAIQRFAARMAGSTKTTCFFAWVNEMQSSRDMRRNHDHKQLVMQRFAMKMLRSLKQKVFYGWHGAMLNTRDERVLHAHQALIVKRFATQMLGSLRQRVFYGWHGSMLNSRAERTERSRIDHLASRHRDEIERLKAEHFAQVAKTHNYLEDQAKRVQSADRAAQAKVEAAAEEHRRARVALHGKVVAKLARQTVRGLIVRIFDAWHGLLADAHAARREDTRKHDLAIRMGMRMLRGARRESFVRWHIFTTEAVQEREAAHAANHRAELLRTREALDLALTELRLVQPELDRTKTLLRQSVSCDAIDRAEAESLRVELRVERARSARLAEEVKRLGGGGAERRDPGDPLRHRSRSRSAQPPAAAPLMTPSKVALAMLGRAGEASSSSSSSPVAMRWAQRTPRADLGRLQ